MAARFRPRYARELEQRLCRSCATAAALEAPPLPPPALDAHATKRPPRTAIDAEIVRHARTLRVDPHSFSMCMLSAESRQCCAYGRLFPKPLLVRFVAANDAEGVSWMIPDAAGHLPGRGAYTLASPYAVELAIQNKMFMRQLRRPVSAAPDLPQRTEEALAQHLAHFARNVAAKQLAGAAGGGRRRAMQASEAAHEWRLCLAGEATAVEDWTSCAPPPEEATEPPLPAGQRSAVRVLFVLRRAELEATLGAAGLAAWQAGRVRLGLRASAALSAAQLRLEGFRPAARPSGLRASGEAPPGWVPPAERRGDAHAAKPLPPPVLYEG